MAAEDEVVETPLTINEMYVFYPQMYGTDEASIALGQSYFADEIYINWTWPDEISFDTVGLYKSGDYQITIVFGKSLSGSICCIACLRTGLCIRSCMRSV